MQKLIDDYLAGPQRLRDAVAGMTAVEIDARPIAGKWSTRQVICHLADFEPVYADRMKRVVAEENPTIFAGNPDVFAARLAYEARDMEEELQLIEAVRKHAGRILKTLKPEDFQRKEKLLTNVTNHIVHHIKFIEEKRVALSNRDE
jgi:uncharacterized damage-inducible protein DinB